jgi:hypothetical protein
MSAKAVLIVVCLALICLALVFFPKDVGGPLCGPVCASKGLHHYERSCLGWKTKQTFTDGYREHCYGLRYGKMRCYGVPFFESGLDKEIDCDYPCGDSGLKVQCQNQTELRLEFMTIKCADLTEACGW